MKGKEKSVARAMRHVGTKGRPLRASFNLSINTRASAGYIPSLKGRRVPVYPSSRQGDDSFL